jgi:hypothetical protein
MNTTSITININNSKPKTGFDDLDEFIVKVSNANSKNDDSPYAYQLYATPKIRKFIKKEEIPLGYLDYNDPSSIVAVPFPKQSTNFLISGGKRGVGKSNLRSLIGFDYLMGAQGLTGLCIDPKREMYTHTQPNVKMESLLENFTLHPVGHENLERLIPSMFAEDGFFLGTEFQFDTSDMNYFDLKTLMQMNSKSYQNAQERLQFMLFGADVATGKVSWKKYRSMPLPSYAELIKRARALAGDKFVNKDILVRALNNLVANGAIGTEKPVDIIGMMQQGKVPIVQTSIDADLNPVASTYCAILLRKIIEERKRFVDSKGKMGRLRKPVVVDIGEFNILYPKGRDVSSKDPIKRIYDQMRYAGISIVADSPSFASIGETAVQQSDWVISFRISSQDDKTALRIRCPNRSVIDSLSNLKIFPDARFGVPPAEAALINTDGELSIFLPFPCLSASLQEGAY